MQHVGKSGRYRRAALSLCRSPFWSQRRSRRVLLRTTDGDTATDANSGVGIIPTFPKAGRVVEMQPGLHIDLGFDRSDDRDSGQRRSDCHHGESCLHHGLAPPVLVRAHADEGSTWHISTGRYVKEVVPS